MSDQTEKRPSLARMQRAAHAAEAMLEKYYDITQIVGSIEDEALKARKTQHLAALKSGREHWDLFAEFPDDFSSFVRELEGKRAAAMKKAAA